MQLYYCQHSSLLTGNLHIKTGSRTGLETSYKSSFQVFQHPFPPVGHNSRFWDGKITCLTGKSHHIFIVTPDMNLLLWIS